MEYQMDNQVTLIVDGAEQEARDMGNNYIGSEHLLLAILKDRDTALTKMLASQGMHYFQLKEDLMVLFGLKDQKIEEIQVTQVVENIMENASHLAMKSQGKQLDVECLSLALLHMTSCVATEILHRYDIDEDALLAQMEDGSMCELDAHSELRNLNRCGVNMDIVGRTKELDFIVSILSRKDKANPLLIGEPGVGKTALVEKLAGMIQKGEVACLKDAMIYELHLNSLVAGTKYRGDFEEKLQTIIQLLQKYPSVILFIDEIHQIIGAGKSEGSIDVASVLKPYLARGMIRCIGATTIDEYEKYIEKDRALERRFQILMIKEPTKEETYAMLCAKINEYEEFHQVHIAANRIQDIVKYCAYYIPARRFPDKAIDVLDLACVVAKNEGEGYVLEAHIRKVIEKLTDIPLSSCNRMQAVRQELNKKILGQSDVIYRLMNQLEWIEQGVISSRPLGVWLFLGGHGVGKTTMIQLLNQSYFNKEETIELDISTLDKSFAHTLAKIRRTPYSIVSITNLHMASPIVLQFWRNAIQKGYIEQQAQRTDLRHCIIIMQGDFAVAKESTLHFNAQKRPYQAIEQAVGKDFIEIFDEIFLFHDLQLQDKVSIVKTMIQKWDKTVEEATLLAVIVSSSSLEEATRKLKRTIVKA